MVINFHFNLGSIILALNKLHPLSFKVFFSSFKTCSSFSASNARQLEILLGRNTRPSSVSSVLSSKINNCLTRTSYCCALLVRLIFYLSAVFITSIEFHFTFLLPIIEIRLVTKIQPNQFLQLLTFPLQLKQ